MKAKLKTYLTLVLIVILGLTNQAIAGGDYYGGAGSIKDYGGTPIPAPIPTPVYDPVWYLRADIGFGFGDGPSASEKGMVFGESASGFDTVHTFGTDPSSIEGDFDQQFNFGVGVGMRWNDRFRMDVTGESRRAEKVHLIDRSRGDLLPGGPHNVASGTVLSETEDQTHIKGGVVLFNAYFDMPVRWGGFTPYIGGGLGFAVSQVNRRNRNTETADYFDAGGTHHSDSLHRPSTDATSGSDTDVSFAAAATVGTSYHLSSITELDLNYRYLYIDGVQSSVVVNGHTSTLETEGTHDHQIRAGLRFNID